MSSQKEQWSSNFGFLMAAVASAVGLGSIWRFPYMVGSNGGSAFIIIYTILILVVGIVGLAIETSIGRAGGVNAVHSFEIINPKTKPFAILGLLSGFLVFTVYSVLGGWVFHYLIKLVIFQLPEISTEGYFHNFRTSLQPMYWQIAFILLTMLVLGQGVAKGIEKYSTFMNISLFVLILIVVVRSITLPGASAGVEFLLKPDFEAFKNPKVWLMAIGQALFSLSLGMGIMITYGCYIPKKSDMLKSGVVVSLTTLMIAILMGFAIFPAVFAMGFNPAAGAGLLFEVLPQVFAIMPGGALFALAFFIATFFAALTSAISIIEPIVAFSMNRFHISRKQTTVFFTILLLFVSIPISLAQGPLSFVTIMNLNLFDFIDFITDKIFLPINLLIAAIVAGWLWKNNGFLNELSNQQTIKLPFPSIILWMARVVIPAIIIIIMIVTFQSMKG